MVGDDSEGRSDDRMGQGEGRRGQNESKDEQPMKTEDELTVENEGLDTSRSEGE